MSCCALRDTSHMICQRALQLFLSAISANNKSRDERWKSLFQAFLSTKVCLPIPHFVIQESSNNLLFHFNVSNFYDSVKSWTGLL